MKKFSPAQKVTRGPIDVVESKGQKIPIYGGLHHGKESYLLAYYSDDKRVRERVATIEAARKRAKEIIAGLTSGTAHVASYTARETAVIEEAIQIARRLNVSLVVALRDYEEARKVLAGQGNLVEAARCYVENLARTRESKTVADAVSSFLDAREEMKESYLKTLRPRLDVFVEFFPKDRVIADLGVEDVRRFLGSLKVSPRTISHNRAHLVALFTHCLHRGWCASNPAEQTLPPKVKADEPVILTPTEGKKILEGSSKEILPGVAIAMFCGLRQAEIEELDWAAVNVTEAIITIGSEIAKTNSRRVVPIPENALAWIKKNAKNSGRVWPEEPIAREHWTLARIHAGFGPFFAVSAGVKAAQEGQSLRPWPHNALRHSAISYRLASGCDLAKLAYESGNSPAVIQRHYNGLASPQGANAWFSIRPK